VSGRGDDRPDVACGDDRPDVACGDDRPDVACGDDRPDAGRGDDRSADSSASSDPSVISDGDASDDGVPVGTVIEGIRGRRLRSERGLSRNEFGEIK